MKKNIFKLLAFVFVAGLVISGCATVSDIRNDYDGLIYNGGNAVQVGDYLYYGNGYKAVGESKTDYAYGGNASYAYLNRVNLETGLASKRLDGVKGSEKFNSRVAGYENQFMFVIGNYIYFTSANQHQNSSLQHDYTLVSFFRAKLNGDDEKELFTSNQFNTSTAQMRVLKGSDENYHWIVYDGTDLLSVRVGNNLGGKVTLAQNVTSIAIPETNSEFSVTKVFVTVTEKDENKQDVSKVYAIDYATGKKEEVTSVEKGTKFISRVGDHIFYTNDTPDGSYQTYFKDISLSEDYSFNGNETEHFYGVKGISNVQAISVGDADEGYVFLGKSEGLMYKNMISGATAEPILANGEFTNILFVDGSYVYYSTADGLYRVDIKGSHTKETIIEVSGLIDSEYTHAGDYIYFYASVQTDESDEVEYEEDDRTYLYRVHESGQGGYQIVSNYTRKVKKEA